MRWSPRELAANVGKAARRLRNLLRRVSVTQSSGGVWTVELGVDETGETFREQAEVFEGAGFSARPPTDQGEAILVTINASADHPVIIATRDEATRASVVKTVGLEPDETIVFNSGYVLKLASDGVKVGAVGGTFKAVALADHTHGPGTFTAGGDSVLGSSGASSSNSTDTKVT